MLLYTLLSMVKLTIKPLDVNGTASMGLNLASNVYKATVSYNGSDKYNAVSKNITVTINPTIVADDLVKCIRMLQGSMLSLLTALEKQ